MADSLPTPRQPRGRTGLPSAPSGPALSPRRRGTRPPRRQLLAPKGAAACGTRMLRRVERGGRATDARIYGHERGYMPTYASRLTAPGRSRACVPARCWSRPRRRAGPTRAGPYDPTGGPTRARGLEPAEAGPWPGRAGRTAGDAVAALHLCQGRRELLHVPALPPRGGHGHHADPRSRPLPHRGHGQGQGVTHDSGHDASQEGSDGESRPPGASCANTRQADRTGPGRAGPAAHTIHTSSVQPDQDREPAVFLSRYCRRRPFAVQ